MKLKKRHLAALAIIPIFLAAYYFRKDGAPVRTEAPLPVSMHEAAPEEAAFEPSAASAPAPARAERPALMEPDVEPAPPPLPEPKPEPALQPPPAPKQEKAGAPKKAPEPPKDEAPPPAPKKEEPKPAPVKEEDKEYLRSVQNVNVTKDKFEEDKAAILSIIEEMEGIMQRKDYGRWLKFITSESISYYQNSRNLKRASERLPTKGITLRNLSDYFSRVFIPARKGRTVNEIRYVSADYVKAVQAIEEADIIYYYFRKIGGEWMIELPKLD